MPDVDPAYVLNWLEKTTLDENSVNIVCNHLFENLNYPKRDKPVLAPPPADVTVTMATPVKKVFSR